MFVCVFSFGIIIEDLGS